LAETDSRRWLRAIRKRQNSASQRTASAVIKCDRPGVADSGRGRRATGECEQRATCCSMAEQLARFIAREATANLQLHIGLQIDHAGKFSGTRASWHLVNVSTCLCSVLIAALGFLRPHLPRPREKHALNMGPKQLHPNMQAPPESATKLSLAARCGGILRLGKTRRGTPVCRITALVHVAMAT
jgi:hypothetical protein